MVVEHNETEERIAWFLEGTCASCYIARSTQFSINAPGTTYVDVCTRLDRARVILAKAQGNQVDHFLVSCTVV